MTVELWSFGRMIGTGSDLRGMSVEALDGGIGKVTDVVEQVGSAYLVVDTGPWIFGKTVTLPAGVVTAIDTAQNTVFIDRVKEDVKNAPEHDPDAPDDTAHREALTAYYGAARESDSAASTPSYGGAGTGPAPFGGSTESEDRLGDIPPAATPFGASNDRDEDQGDTPASTLSAGAASDREESSGTAWSPTPAVDRDDAATGGDAGTTSDLGEDQEDAPPSTPSIGAAGDREESRTGGDIGTSSPSESPSAAGDATEQRKPESPKTRRFARDTDSKEKPARKRPAGPPIARYDSLTAAEVVARLRELSQRELGEVERYEKRHEGRQTVLSRIESLREDQPWRGYDDATVGEIKKKLADADEARAKAVRDYERRHKDRKGVMEAARRSVAAA